MIYLLEITEWGDNTPNHIYIFENKKSSKCMGYIKNSTKEIKFFNKPLSFDKKKRKFKEIKVS